MRPLAASSKQQKRDRVLSYAELAQLVREQLPRARPYALVAESFSGPIALQVAASASPAFVVLCASFVRSPVAAAARLLPWRTLFRAPSSTRAIAWALTGGDLNLAEAVARELARVDPDVLAHRVRSVLRLDDARVLARVSAPLLYVRATRDRVVPAAAAEVVRRCHPGVEVVEVDAPHLVLQTAPSAVWKELPARGRERR